jgi:hypothetical protein
MILKGVNYSRFYEFTDFITSTLIKKYQNRTVIEFIDQLILENGIINNLVILSFGLASEFAIKNRITENCVNDSSRSGSSALVFKDLITDSNWSLWDSSYSTWPGHANPDYKIELTGT